MRTLYGVQVRTPEPPRPRSVRWGCSANAVRYWQGGPPRLRQFADLKLRDQIEDRLLDIAISRDWDIGPFGDTIERVAIVVAWICYCGIRILGHPVWPTPWRWGYGYPYRGGYGSWSRFGN